MEAKTGRAVQSPEGVLAEVFLSRKAIALSLATDVTEATLGASDLWLGTRTGAGGTATVA